MPAPDSSRDHAFDAPWNESNSPWPVDPAAPDRLPKRSGGHPLRRQEQSDKPEQDGRLPHDPDGNEELEREVEDEEEPASRRTPTERSDAYGANRPSRWDFETEDTGEWVATERFTFEDEIDDTWPNVPARFLDD